jgi:hypothetical protein
VEACFLPDAPGATSAASSPSTPSRTRDLQGRGRGTRRGGWIQRHNFSPSPTTWRSEAGPAVADSDAKLPPSSLPPASFLYPLSPSARRSSGSTATAMATAAASCVVRRTLSRAAPAPANGARSGARPAGGWGRRGRQEEAEGDANAGGNCLTCCTTGCRCSVGSPPRVRLRFLLFPSLKRDANGEHC